MKTFLIFTLLLASFGIISSFFQSEKLSFFSRSHTNLLKGFAILTVFWGHIGLSYHIYGLQWIAAIGVSLFLICSGYGLEASFKKNGLKNFWLKRFVAVIIPYWIVYALAKLLLSSNFSYHSILDILNFSIANWYIPFILIVYVLYWEIKFLTVKLNLSKKIFNTLLLFIFTIWFIIVSYYFINPDAPTLLARQIFAFPLGVFLYDHRSKAKNIFTSHSIKVEITFIGLGIIGLGMTIATEVIAKQIPNVLNNFLSLFAIIPLALIIIKVSCTVYNLFSNVLFSFMGTISYEIYLLQYFTRTLINLDPISIYFCFFLTLILSSGFYAIYKLISNKILISFTTKKKAQISNNRSTK